MLPCLAVTRIFLLKLLFVSFADGWVEQKRWKRERAFNLLRLEAAFATDEEMERLHIADGRRVDRRMVISSGALSEDRCQAHCNDELRSGLDMVKAHTSFGSIGVPSVIDKFDLHLFCRLDTQHDRCLRSCGFEIQFNMRDYICRDRYKEMISNLWCYGRAAPTLKRQCGAARCGPYAELETTLAGYGQRCRTLVCDLSCTQIVLERRCGPNQGRTAARLLLDYTRVQVSTWIRDAAQNVRRSMAEVMPASCSRLFCDRFDTAANCSALRAVV